jgi:hypothetical protein
MRKDISLPIVDISPPYNVWFALPSLTYFAHAFRVNGNGSDLVVCIVRLNATIDLSTCSDFAHRSLEINQLSDSFARDKRDSVVVRRIVWWSFFSFLKLGALGCFCFGKAVKISPRMKVSRGRSRKGKGNSVIVHATQLAGGVCAHSVM